MTEEKIARINQLARKAKSEGLSKEEQAEQAALRREYIDSIRASLTGQLENISVMDASGRLTKLKKRSD